MNNGKLDTVLAEIVQQMKDGDAEWRMPWHGKHKVPCNILSGGPYRGLNRLILVSACQTMGYEHATWGTLRQWNSRGSKVIRGQKATTLALPVFKKNKRNEDELAYFKPFWVFNANQVANYDPDHPSLFDEPAKPLLPTIGQLVTNSKAKIDFGLNFAWYSPREDRIGMPEPSQFFATPTSSADEGFYSALLHELAHWSGHPSRLNREGITTSGRKDVYAFEELTAELAAAFLCMEFEINDEPRKDHAQYLNSWLGALDNDISMLWRAAGQAQRAVDFLLEFAAPKPDHRPAFALEAQPFQPELL